MLRIDERTNDPISLFQRLQDSVGFDLRVASPGIIDSVDCARQTVTVQLAIREKLVFDGNPEWVEIPVLLDVPFFVYSGGGYCLTMPIRKGDECLVVFGDNCFDALWQSGGVQNQVERRRHDLSDGFAIVGFRSQPNVVPKYSSSSAQLRTLSGDAIVEISGNNIKMTCSGHVDINGGSIGVTSGNVNVNTEGNVSVTGGNVSIQGRDFLNHTHSGIQPGGGTTGGVT